MKKLFAALPMIWLILGAVVIATEIHKPMSLGQPLPEQTKVHITTTVKASNDQLCPLNTPTPVCANK
jgi:hypothetical protein